MMVVVGGHSRNIGKTAVAEGLIRALPEAAWTAVKITQFGHAVCVAAGKPCECASAPQYPYVIAEETTPSSRDTGRFLAAGARRAFWVRAAQGRLGEALPALRGIFAAGPNTIVESNSLLEFLRPDLYLVVADFAIPDFKPSTLRHLDRADALVVIERKHAVPAWKEVPPELWSSKLQFRVQPPRYVTAELAAFVRTRLSGPAPGGESGADGCTDRAAS